MKDFRNDSVALGANQRSEKQSSKDLAAVLQMIPIGDFGNICTRYEEMVTKGKTMNLEECLRCGRVCMRGGGGSLRRWAPTDNSMLRRSATYQHCT